MCVYLHIYEFIWLLFIFFTRVSEGLWFVEKKKKDKSHLKLEVCFLWEYCSIWFWLYIDDYKPVFVTKTCQIIPKKQRKKQQHCPVFTPVFLRADEVLLCRYFLVDSTDHKPFLRSPVSPPFSMLGSALGPQSPLSNFMFSGRLSLTIICKNQSVSINFEIAAVNMWPACGVFMAADGSPAVHKRAVWTTENVLLR